jgi:hypothetical protein
LEVIFPVVGAPVSMAARASLLSEHKPPYRGASLQLEVIFPVVGATKANQWTAIENRVEMDQP